MVKKLLVLCAVIVLSVNYAYAVEGNSPAAVAPDPPVEGNTTAAVAPDPLFKDPISGMELVFVKGGCYQMGDTSGVVKGGPEEKPVHEVCVDDFYLGKYEVTQGQWKQIMGSNPSRFSSCGDDCPVDNVSWNDAQNFVNILNKKNEELNKKNKDNNKKKKENKKSTYRLPTEAEWEYAARSGGKGEPFSGGKDADSVAWYDPNSDNKSHPVGTKAPNGLGIYDMSGNVWEWTNDWYASDYYSNSPRKNPGGPDSGDSRVLRGGYWGVRAFDVRPSYRSYHKPDYRGGVNGFRLLRTM